MPENIKSFEQLLESDIMRGLEMDVMSDSDGDIIDLLMTDSDIEKAESLPEDE